VDGGGDDGLGGAVGVEKRDVSEWACLPVGGQRGGQSLAAGDDQPQLPGGGAGIGFEEEKRLAQVLWGQVEHGDGVALCAAAEFVGCPEFGFA